MNTFLKYIFFATFNNITIFFVVAIAVFLPCNAQIINFNEQQFKNSPACSKIKPYTWCNMNTYLSKYTISTSDNGKGFSKLKDITVTGITNTTYVPVPKSREKFVRSCIKDIITIRKFRCQVIILILQSIELATHYF